MGGNCGVNYRVGHRRCMGRLVELPRSKSCRSCPNSNDAEPEWVRLFRKAGNRTSGDRGLGKQTYNDISLDLTNPAVLSAAKSVTTLTGPACHGCYGTAVPTPSGRIRSLLNADIDELRYSDAMCVAQKWWAGLRGRAIGSRIRSCIFRSLRCQVRTDSTTLYAPLSTAWMSAILALQRVGSACRLTNTLSI